MTQHFSSWIRQQDIYLVWDYGNYFININIFVAQLCVASLTVCNHDVYLGNTSSVQNLS